MHAVVVRVTVNDREAATQGLREDVVPAVSQAPGFVAGYWTRKEGSDQGLSMVVFESEDAANAAAERIQSDGPRGRQRRRRRGARGRRQRLAGCRGRVRPPISRTSDEALRPARLRSRVALCGATIAATPAYRAAAADQGST